VRLREQASSVELPPAFDAWMLRCIDRDPLKRFASAGAAVKALAQVLEPAPRAALEPSPAPIGEHLRSVHEDDAASESSSLAMAGSKRRRPPLRETTRRPPARARALLGAATHWVVLGAASGGLLLGAVGWLVTRDREGAAAPATAVTSTAVRAPAPPAPDSPPPSAASERQVHPLLDLPTAECCIRTPGPPAARPRGAPRGSTVRRPARGLEARGATSRGA
jgi:hypothetical protein